MANEYLINRDDLVIVADAIRTKGDTTEQLVFPGGFVTAIHGISTGVALNFQVVGGTSAPANPTENTIWVNTDQEITSWVFSHNQPDSPSEGMVWIVNGASSISEFDAVSDVSLRVQVESVKQYIGGSWAVKKTEVYQNGVWNKTILNLYNSGNEYVSTTGGWVAKNTRKFGGSDGYVKTAPTITKNKQYISVSLPANQGPKTGAIETANSIDVTNFDTLIVEFSDIVVGTYVNYYVQLVSSNAATYLQTTGNDVPAVWKYSGNNICTLDISSVKGNYVIAIVYQHYSDRSKGGSFNMTNARLE